MKLSNFSENLEFKGKILAKFLLRRHLLAMYDNKTTN